MAQPTRFEVALKTALLEVPEQEVKDFFEQKFLTPLNVALDGDDKVPAETIRHKRQQTNHIKNCLLTLRGK